MIIMTMNLLFMRLKTVLSVAGGLSDFVSSIFTLFTITVERRPEYANEISGLIIFAVSGGAAIPPIAGLLTDTFGVVASIYVLLACILYVAFATYYVIKKSN